MCIDVGQLLPETSVWQVQVQAAAHLGVKLEWLGAHSSGAGDVTVLDSGLGLRGP